jgi:hypothetical protein
MNQDRNLLKNAVLLAVDFLLNIVLGSFYKVVV